MNGRLYNRLLAHSSCGEKTVCKREWHVERSCSLTMFTQPARISHRLNIPRLTEIALHRRSNKSRLRESCAILLRPEHCHRLRPTECAIEDRTILTRRALPRLSR